MASIAVALFDFEGQRSDNLSFQQGDVITVIKQDESGWWTGSDKTGRIGIFPYNYVQLKVDDATVFKVAKALYDFESDDPEDLPFKEGEMVTIIQELSPEWMLGRSEDGKRTGQFPSSFVEIQKESPADDDAKKVKAIEAEAKKFEELERKAKAEADKALKERLAAEKKLEEEAARKKKELAKAAEKRLEEEARAAKERAAKREEERLKERAEAARRREEKAARELAKAKELAEKRKKQEDDARRRQSARIEASKARDEIQRMAIQAKTVFQGQDPGPPPAVDEEEAEEAGGNQVEDEPDADKLRGHNRREVNFKYRNKFSNLGGGTKCPKCGKTVGFADKVKALGGEWHRNCFRCTTCHVILRPGQFNDNNGTPYCRICYGKSFGPKGFGFGGVTVPVDRKERRPDHIAGMDADAAAEAAAVVSGGAEVIKESQMLPKKRDSKRNSKRSSRRASAAKAK